MANKLYILVLCTTIICSCSSPTSQKAPEETSPEKTKQPTTPEKADEAPVQGIMAPSDEVSSRGLTGESADNTITTAAFPSWNPDFPPPANAKNTFALSQDYPTTFNDKEVYPWEKIDFKTKPNDYAMAVLKYGLEGNIDVEFKGQNNKVRKWYHAPWLHEGTGGREWTHGMTRERMTPKFELHAKQDIELENWAVGMYNPAGGYAIGKVWRTKNGKPDPTKSDFPRGSVAFKLLFTDAKVEKVPFLANTFEWQGNIYPCMPQKCSNRENRTVRLLQIDIAVKEPRAPLGWVLGTFTYDASMGGATPWERLAPVGLSWGDDGAVTAMMNNVGSFINPNLKETWINPKLIEDKTKTKPEQNYMRHHGLGGRLNGPVDNPSSSCISCHARAAVTAEGEPFAVMPRGAKRETYTGTDFKKFFSPVKSGSYTLESEGKKYTTTDYSLQLAFGIRAYYQNLIEQEAKKDAAKSGTKSRGLEGIVATKKLPELSRGE
jgi:hypothetical protein